MQKILNTLARLAACLAIAFAFGYGLYGLVTYAIPLQHSQYRVALASEVGDPVEVLINGAAEDYDNGRVQEATKVLELSLEKLVNQSGKYNKIDSWKLERVYFLLGKIYQKQKALEKAAENYENTLRLNPRNLAAKYNLEMVRQPPQGGKDSGGQTPKPTTPQPKI